MKKVTKQVREALREKQPFAFTYRQLPMCVSPRICGAGICVGNRMFLAYTAALIRKIAINLYQLPARYDGRPYRDQRNYYFRIMTTNNVNLTLAAF